MNQPFWIADSFTNLKVPLQLHVIGFVYHPILNGFLFRPKIHLFAQVFLAILAILAFFAVIRHFSRHAEHTKEHLVIDHEAIPWSNIDHITLKRSPLGNRYLAVYFKDNTPPKGFDIQYIDKKEELLRYLKDSAPEKGFTFTSER
ncbi:MAG: hypothetical protein HXS48_12455 [Theionarchaea archaeon]|nr:hypothetical protein [Theionarchaea archaeon]